ncbi:MAG: NUDIX hydrolase [Thermodesulfobacteriota bacterium]|nr:NUDIX hydrolase [Thermodesulfobacteriota bacterium]
MKREIRYCLYCGKKLTDINNSGKKRLYCTVCKEILYENPLPAVVALVTDETGRKILLVKRSEEPARGKWCLPGGFIEADEKPEDAALRELFEETGLKGKIGEFVGISSQLSTFYRKMILLCGFKIENSVGELKAGDDAEKAEWFPFENYPALAFISHHELLNKLKEMV